MIHPVFPACRRKHPTAQRAPWGVILNPDKRLPPQGKRQGEGSVLLFNRTPPSLPCIVRPPLNGFFATRPAQWGRPSSSFRMTSGVGRWAVVIFDRSRTPKAGLFIRSRLSSDHDTSGFPGLPAKAPFRPSPPPRGVILNPESVCRRKANAREKDPFCCSKEHRRPFPYRPSGISLSASWELRFFICPHPWDTAKNTNIPNRLIYQHKALICNGFSTDFQRFFNGNSTVFQRIFNLPSTVFYGRMVLSQRKDVRWFHPASFLFSLFARGRILSAGVTPTGRPT